jgi:hypothetical protein
MTNVNQSGEREGQQVVLRLLTKVQLAQALSLSPRTIEGLMKRGLPHIKLSRAVRFILDDVIRFLKSRNQVGAFCEEVHHG